jgi:hypothetical protein
MDMASFLTSIEAMPLAQWLNLTSGAFAFVESLHVVGLALVYGTIFIVDLRLLGYPNTRRPFTEIAAETLRWTWAGFALAAVTGSLMFITNAVFYFGNFEFRMKMLLLVLAAANMVIFEFFTVRSVKSWDSNEPVPLAGRIAGLLSILFWTGVIIYGRLIGFAASAMEDPFAALG